MPWKRRYLKTIGYANYVACAGIVAMMLLTCADVLLRIARHPIPGTYEVVGFLATVVTAFALGQTSVDRGHIAVEFFTSKLPVRWQTYIDGLEAAVGAALSGLLAWQSAVYARDLQASGEVSLTLAMPISPFALGIAVGCALLCCVLIVDFIRFVRRVVLS
ncbi:MAG: TRAP transporter small permease [Deltaproteobacteria bacterium HGW-Deltaproteobacteria-19]|jgi:TRAP-type C4-dicarboxylate transport system permease small subunit|nr:MAG: TRAP transporter small permease [Deltaproteobacteria bacterium HGW-Deltaproteobacteria-19]